MTDINTTLIFAESIHVGEIFLHKLLIRDNIVNISSFTKTLNNITLKTTNNDKYIVLKPTENVGGYRINKSYIQEDIDKEILYNIIMPISKEIEFFTKDVNFEPFESLIGIIENPEGKPIKIAFEK